MCRVTVFWALTEPHLLTSALVVPAYPDPELVKVIVNGCAVKPGAANSAPVVRVHLFPVQSEENFQVSFHFCPTLRLAPAPGVRIVVTCTGTSPCRGGLSVAAARAGVRRDCCPPHLAATRYW